MLVPICWPPPQLPVAEKGSGPIASDTSKCVCTGEVVSVPGSAARQNTVCCTCALAGSEAVKVTRQMLLTPTTSVPNAEAALAHSLRKVTTPGMLVEREPDNEGKGEIATGLPGV